jgi:hypothetical protein
MAASRRLHSARRGRGAQGVVADRAQRQAEGRVRHPPRDQEQHEQHAERIEIGRAAEDVEVEQAQDRGHHDALQAIGAAGERAQGVGQLVQDQGHAERDHQAREVAAAQHERSW